MARSKDPEIKALSSILEMLSGLEPSVRNRIIQYVCKWDDDQNGSPDDLGIIVGVGSSTLVEGK